VLAIPLALVACGGSSTTTTAASTATTAAPGGTATTAPAATATTAAAGGTTTTVAAGTDTITIGAVIWTQWPLGYDMKRGVDVMAAIDNANGGIQIGDKKYQVKFDFIESNNDQATTMSAVNKLIYQDKVKFMITETQFPGAFFAETEKNKVVTLTGCPIPTMFDKSYKYTFQGGTMMQATPEVAGWIAKNTPAIKTVDLAFPDEAGGIGYATGVQKTLEAYGIKVNPIKYPSQSTDLSAIGTQVKTDSPTAFMACGNSATDALVYQAVVQAGYKGLLFSTTTVTYDTLKSAVPAAALEGFIGGAWPVEFDPAATDVAKEFKAKWIEMYGKWEGPEIQMTACYAALRAALEKAGSMDTDTVANVLANGLTWEGPCGKGEMIPRNDMGISRTVDNIDEFCVKKIVNGVPTLLHQITLDEGKGYVNPAVFATTTPSS
jgi:branched-chain amino acid transport system substrate-binding protein